MDPGTQPDTQTYTRQERNMADNSVPMGNTMKPPLRCKKACLIIVSVILMIFSLGCGQLSMFHLSMTLGILSNVSTASTNTSNSTNALDESLYEVNDERIAATKMFLLVLFAIVTPYALNFIRAFLVTLGRSDLRKPDCRMTLLGFIQAVLESTGVSIMAIKVFPLYNGVACSLIICSIPLFSMISIIVYLLHKRRIREWRFSISVVTGLLYVAGSATMILWIRDTPFPMRYIFPIIGLVLLSCAWLPPISKYTVAVEARENESETDCFRKTEAAWRMSLYSNGFKFMLSVIVSFILYLFSGSVYKLETLWNFWEEFKLAWAWNWDYDTQAFLVLICSCFVAHELGLFLCRITSTMFVFLFPSFLANTVIMFLLWNGSTCGFFLYRSPVVCTATYDPRWALIVSTSTFAIAAFLSLLLFTYKQEHILLRREEQIVWLPSFTTVAPGVWTILNKRMWPWDMEQAKHAEQNRGARFFICTTMYRETKDEMTQLLRSFKNVSDTVTPEEIAQKRYELHIVFDDGMKGENLTTFALQFLALVQPILDIPCGQFLKTIQPYGVKLSWQKTEDSTSVFKIPISIHLKDSDKVKKKKRWSQIMYMKMIIEDPSGSHKGAHRYILTTDADVRFTKESVEALLDLMSRDPSVGAVTGRTHPMGHGFCVWYQIFEYAISHWLQKTAEHCLGSVLCAPGCFSLFRCAALKEVVEEYSTDISCGMDFLTKDMGEDRWLCTLLIQSGWTIEYCAVSNNETNCPDTFSEFFKQRRRWVASTIANMLMQLRDYKKFVTSERKQLSMGFLAYQAIMLCSAFIAPSTVILVVTGGLNLAWNINVVASLVVQVIACVVFAAVCLSRSVTPAQQLSAARWLSIVYCVLMAVVAVGSIKEIVDDFIDTNTPSGNIPLRVSATTLYMLVLIALFVVTAILHWDFIALCYGVFFFLCIPATFMVLVIYSLCNITDRSWGTREAESFIGEDKSLLGIFLKWITEKLQWISENVQACCCNRKQQTTDQPADAFPQSPAVDTQDPSRDMRTKTPVMDVGTWFDYQDKDLKQYSGVLKEHGYEDIQFLSHLQLADLDMMSIRNKRHAEALVDATEKLPYIYLSSAVPVDIKTWLEDIGLDMYQSENLSIEDITNKEKSPSDMAGHLGIKKIGHLSRLELALSCVRHPSKEDRDKEAVRKEIAGCQIIKKDELDSFWKKLVKECLQHPADNFAQTKKLKDELIKLRDYWLQIMALFNVIWLIFIATLASQSELTVLGTNAFGLLLLTIFVFVALIQFFTMLFHRVSTLVHVLARMPTTQRVAENMPNERTHLLINRTNE